VCVCMCMCVCVCVCVCVRACVYVPCPSPPWRSCAVAHASACFYSPCVQVPEYLQHVALVCARFKTLEKELDAVRTFPGVSVFAHAQDARETATAPVQAQAVVDLSVTGAMSGAAYSIRLYLPASSAPPLVCVLWRCLTPRLVQLPERRNSAVQVLCQILQRNFGGE